MRWTSLGHACWLIEAAGLRLLCDPLLGVEHHGDTVLRDAAHVRALTRAGLAALGRAVLRRVDPARGRVGARAGFALISS